MAYDNNMMNGNNIKELLQELNISTVASDGFDNSSKIGRIDNDCDSVLRPVSDIIFLRDIHCLRSLQPSTINMSSLIEQESCDIFSPESLFTGNTTDTQYSINDNNLRIVIPETPECSESVVADSTDNIVSANAKNVTETKKIKKCNSVKRQRREIMQEESIGLPLSFGNLKCAFTRYNNTDVVLQSIKNILSILCEKNQGSSVLELKKEDAVRAILSYNKVRRTPLELQAYTKCIVEALQSTFERIIYTDELHNVRSWMYRLPCILQLCNSREICACMMEFLTIGFDAMGCPDNQNDSTTVANNNPQTMYYQLHVLLFGLDIIVQKMKEIMSLSEREKVRSKKTRIPSVELNDGDFSENYRQAQHSLERNTQRWANALQTFSGAMIDQSPELALRSLKLRDTLLSL